MTKFCVNPRNVRIGSEVMPENFRLGSTGCLQTDKVERLMEVVLRQPELLAELKELLSITSSHWYDAGIKDGEDFERGLWETRHQEPC